MKQGVLARSRGTKAKGSVALVSELRGKASPLILLSMLSAALCTEGCKPRNATTDQSGVKSDINFAGETISLDRYIANANDYAGMKQEFQAMAANNNGKPNYQDGVYAIQNNLRPKFSTIQGYTMNMEEQVALLVWTVGNAGQNSPFERINAALRSPTVKDDGAVDSTTKVLASAINKLQGRPCRGARGVRNLPSAYLSLGVGDVFKDNGFVAFGWGEVPPVPFNQMPIYIHVTSSNCKVISEFSKFGAEAEVLFPPGTDFRVLSVGTAGGRTVFRLSHTGARPDQPQDDSPAVADHGDGAVNPAGLGDGGGALSAADFVDSRFKNTQNRTLWLNADRVCSAKSPAKPPRACTWSFTAPNQIEAVFNDNGDTWFYKALSKLKICFTGDGAPGANCAGEMTRYTPVN